MLIGWGGSSANNILPCKARGSVLEYLQMGILSNQLYLKTSMKYFLSLIRWKVTKIDFMLLVLWIVLYLSTLSYFSRISISLIFFNNPNWLLIRFLAYASANKILVVSWVIKLFTFIWSVDKLLIFSVFLILIMWSWIFYSSSWHYFSKMSIFLVCATWRSITGLEGYLAWAENFPIML